jgi:hypothetical protein
MPGWWETPSNVMVAVLHVETTTIAWSLGLRRLQIPGAFQDPLLLTAMPFDMSRNRACQIMLEQGADYIFFLDSDVIPPPDTIHKLLRHNLPIVSGVYHRRSPPHGVPVMMRPVGQWITHYPPNQLIEVDVVGAGCLLIRRDLLEKMPPQRPGHHWFDWRVHLKGTQGISDGECLSEDFTFNTACKRMGVKIMVDTGIQCKHIGLAEATYNRFEPCCA